MRKHMETKENNLKVYLKEQMEEYHQECESIKALYADLLEHIEDCKDQIRQQKEREDPGFALLSPLAGQAATDSISVHLEEQIEAYERQKGKYQQQLHFYEEKIAEMQAQLDEFAHNEQLKAEWELKLQAEQAALQAEREQATAADAKDAHSVRAGVENKGQVNDVHEDHYDLKNEKSASAEISRDKKTAPESVAEQETAASEEMIAAAVSAAVNKIVSRDKKQLQDACSYMIRKLTEMKGYVQMDPMRCRMELDRLLQYMQRLEEEAGAAGEQA